MSCSLVFTFGALTTFIYCLCKLASKAPAPGEAHKLHLSRKEKLRRKNRAKSERCQKSPAVTAQVRKRNPLKIIAIGSLVALTAGILLTNLPSLTDEQVVTSLLTTAITEEPFAYSVDINNVEPGLDDDDTIPRLLGHGKKTLTAKQIADASSIAKAIATSKLKELQAITEFYEHKPRALAEIASALHRANQRLKTGLVFYTHAGRLYMGPESHKSGDFELVIPASKETAAVLVWAVDGGRSYCEVTKEILPRMVLKRMQLALIQSILLHARNQNMPQTLS